jgi:hypothetical protein
MISNFYDCNLQKICDNMVFFHSRPFQPSLKFVSKAGDYLRKTPFRCSTIGKVPVLTPIHETRVERPVKKKRFSLL